jgi:5-methylcytosine-specific restriction endonuclease McrA
MNRLARCERRDLASLIAHIGEFDERKLYLKLGYSSTYTYCREVLKLSEHEVYRRIEVARDARRYPEILEKLADGSMNLSTVDLVAPVLKPANCHEVLEEASGKTKRQVQQQVAALDPKPDVRLTVTPVPLGAPARDVHSTFKPLSPGRERVCFTMDTSTIEKLNRAKDLLSHALPPGDGYGEIIERAVTLLLAELEKKRCGKTDRPRPCRAPTPGSDYIPANIKRAVWERDGGRCTFVGKNDRRCDATSFLQEHHIVARAKGGETTVANLTLRCGSHNRYEAELAFGPRVVSERRAAYRAGTRSRPSSGRSGAHINKVAVVTPAEVSYAAATRSRPSPSLRDGP